MPNVRVDDECFDDPRFSVLGASLSIDPDLARFKMIRVWRYCTRIGSHLLEQKYFNALFGHDNASRFALESGLCIKDKSGKIYVKGTKGRIEWLAKLKENAKKGGKSKALKSKANGKLSATKRQPVAKQKAKQSAAFSIEEEEAKAKAEVKVEAVPGKDTGPPGHSDFIDHFHRLFQAANGGAAPSWGSRNGKIVKDLLAEHGFDECRKRATNMFEAPPPFPPPPYDLASFKLHFDKFASPGKTKTSGHFKVDGNEAYAGGEVEL